MIGGGRIAILVSRNLRRPSKFVIAVDRCCLSSISSDYERQRKNAAGLRSKTGQEWRKHQLDKLEEKFTSEDSDILIQSDEDLQPMWKNMESRVTNRRCKTIAEMGGKSGRENIKKTEEEMWLHAGVYDIGTRNE